MLTPTWFRLCGIAIIITTAIITITIGGIITTTIVGGITTTTIGGTTTTITVGGIIITTTTAGTTTITVTGGDRRPNGLTSHLGLPTRGALFLAGAVPAHQLHRVAVPDESMLCGLERDWLL